MIPERRGRGGGEGGEGRREVGVRQRGSQADARAIKATGECDECGQSVKPPLKSQYYFEDILWCLRGLYKDKMGREGGGQGVEEERGKRGKGWGSLPPLAVLFHPPIASQYHPLYLPLHTPYNCLFPFHFPFNSSSSSPSLPSVAALLYPPPVPLLCLPTHTFTLVEV